MEEDKEKTSVRFAPTPTFKKINKKNYFFQILQSRTRREKEKSCAQKEKEGRRGRDQNPFPFVRS